MAYGKRSPSPQTTDGWRRSFYWQTCSGIIAGLRRATTANLMKSAFYPLILSVGFALLACGENAENTSNTSVRQAQPPAAAAPPAPSPPDLLPPPVPTYYEHRYVVARSGLNYRAAPRGEVLGKYPLNTSLKIITDSKITEQVVDAGKTLLGTWLGVEKGSDTVYVFGGYLAPNPLRSALRLYYAEPYYEAADGSTRTGFLNLSETYFAHRDPERRDGEPLPLLSEADLAYDTIRLDAPRRRQFLKRAGISESDQVFIYHLRDGRVTTLPVRQLPVLACINVYFSAGDYDKSELDYEFGFDLGKNAYGDFAAVGSSNPFRSGKLTPMIWTPIAPQEFPHPFDPDRLLGDRKRRLAGYRAKECFRFSTDSLDYYVQNLVKERGSIHRYLVVVDAKTGTLVFEDYQVESEGTSLTALRSDGSDLREQMQWTGQLLQDRATVMFGFAYYSFSCPFLTVLDPTEPPVAILCDNRH